MAILSMFVTKSKYLQQLPIHDGQLIYTMDGNRIALDFNGARYYYDTIQSFETEEQRTSFVSVLDGYYYVKDTSCLWSYSNSQWNRLTPENLDPIVFGNTVEDFPAEGKSNTLYVADKATYKWNAGIRGYDPVANLTEWEKQE